MTLRPVGFRDLQQQLTDVLDRGADPRPMLGPLGESFRQVERQQFASGKGWKPLSPEYAAQKAREGRSPKIGVYSGGLRDSLTSKYDRYAVERYARRTRRGEAFILGSANPVGNLFSGKHKRRNQPKRNAVRLPAKTRREWLAWVQEFIVEGRVP